MATPFRKTARGRFVFAILAGWVAERLGASSLTLPEWAATGYKLADIGVNRVSAIAELRGRIPEAHTWYNANGDRAQQYETREQYWDAVLFNRAFYFFHKHAKSGGGLVPCVAEWPGKISEDRLTLVAPEIPGLDGQEEAP